MSVKGYEESGKVLLDFADGETTVNDVVLHYENFFGHDHLYFDHVVRRLKDGLTEKLDDVFTTDHVDWIVDNGYPERAIGNVADFCEFIIGTLDNRTMSFFMAAYFENQGIGKDSEMDSSTIRIALEALASFCKFASDQYWIGSLNEELCSAEYHSLFVEELLHNLRLKVVSEDARRRIVDMALDESGINVFRPKVLN